MRFSVFLVVITLGWLAVGLSTMLGINMFHHYYWDFIPTIGYGSALMISLFPYLFALFWAFVGEAARSANK